MAHEAGNESPDHPRSVTSRTAGSWTLVLFAVYSVVLIGVILFKFPFAFQIAGTGRILNLVPLEGSFTPEGTLRLGEILDNVVIFVPLGVYIRMLKEDWSFLRKVLLIIGTTVAFETIQYVFAIGRADITDVITNTTGGIVGIGIHAGLTKVLRNRTGRVLNAAATILTACALLFVAFLFARSRSVRG